MASGRHHEQWHLHGKEPEAVFLTVPAGNPGVIFMQGVEAPIASASYMRVHGVAVLAKNALALL